MFWDERLSTAAVTRTLLEADVSRARRSELVDKMAAAYILQGLLDRLGSDPAQADWPRALRISLATRLGELVRGWQACGALRAEIDTGLTGAAPALARRPTLGARALHRDHGMALLSALAAVVAVSFCSLVWIQTAWPSGSVAAMMSAIFCCFFASMDDPVPAISSFLKATAWSMPIGAVYVLVLLPLAHDFGMLVLVCAPAFVGLGCLAARPATAGPGMAMIMGVAGSLALGDTATLDLPYFFNSNLSLLMGIAVAALVNRLMRSVGSDVAARRLRRAARRHGLKAQNMLPALLQNIAQRAVINQPAVVEQGDLAA